MVPSNKIVEKDIEVLSPTLITNPQHLSILNQFVRLLGKQGSFFISLLISYDFLKLFLVKLMYLVYLFMCWFSVDYVRPEALGESTIGRHSEERTHQRNERLAFHEEEDTLVTALMEEFNTSKAGRKSPVKVRESALNNVNNSYRPGEFMSKPTIGGN